MELTKTELQIIQKMIEVSSFKGDSLEVAVDLKRKIDNELNSLNAEPEKVVAEPVAEVAG